MAPPTPEPTRKAVDACRELGKILPDTVAGQHLRDITPESPFTAAWGDPPITLRCGVPRPPGLRPDSALTEVNGVSWFAEQVAGAWRFTTYGRVAYVEVEVPNAYQPQVDALVDVSAAIDRADRLDPLAPPPP